MQLPNSAMSAQQPGFSSVYSTLPRRPAQRIKVGMVLDHPYPGCPRVERQLVTLVNCGYEVHVLCRQSEQAGQMTEEAIQGLYVHRVNPASESASLRRHFLGWSENSYRWLRRGIRWIHRTLWGTDPDWEVLIHHFVKSFGIQILHVQGLPLLTTALRVAQKANIMTVADLYHHDPARLSQTSLPRAYDPVLQKHPPALSWKQRSARKHWEQLEKQAAWMADHVIVWSEESRRRLMSAGVPPYHISVLENTIDRNELHPDHPVDTATARWYRSRFVLTYVGFMEGAERGLETLLHSMAQLKHEMPELFLLLIGPIEPDYHQALLRQIHALELTQHVECLGWMSPQHYGTFFHATDIIVSPHLNTEDLCSRIPDPIYLAQAHGRAIIASQLPDVARYLTRTQSGLLYEPGNATELADRIRTLFQDEALRHHLGNNGRMAMELNHHWAATSERTLTTLYRDLEGQEAEPILPVYQRPVMVTS
ncbi:MAG: glycosyltransferase family 4 protein [Candidatus Melainabacteria bacterium]|nr:glycosyltransferase family 4 protein [Candidatus Melainabacteria bacterium]